MEKHKGAPSPEALQLVDQAKASLDKTWTQGLSFLDFTQKYAQPQALDIAHQQTYGKQAIEIAGINEQYQKLVGTTSEQYAAQLKVTQATEQYNEVAYSGNAKLLTAMKQVNEEQQRRLTIQSQGTFGQNLGLVVGDQMRNMGGNFYYATQTANVLNSSLDKLNDSLLKLLDTSHMTSSQMKSMFEQMAVSILSDIQKIILKMLEMQYIVKPLLSFMGLGSLFGGAGGAGGSISTSSLTGYLSPSYTPTFGLPSFDSGGISDSPGTYYSGVPEAHVPLSSGGYIPVKLSGGGGHASFGDIIVNMAPGGPGANNPMNYQDAVKFARMMQDAVVVAVDKRIDEHMRTGGKFNKRTDLR